MAVKTKITRQDLKIYPSERLTQTEDGGGMPLGTPLTGALNELFKPIGSVARLNGAFFAVLEYMGVLRPDNEPLISPFACITKPPADPTVSYLLFKASRFGEMRAEILKRIEAYNVKTIESRTTLLSVQSKDSKVVQAYQSVGEPLPNVGDRYCLDQNMGGYPKVEQYIQVTRVTAEDREFTDRNGNKFKKTVLKLELSTKLEADFVGVDYPEQSYVNNPCKIRETGVADAAQFYGIKPLVQAITKQSMQLKISSIMEKIAPVNQISTPLLDLTAAGQRQTLFDGSRTGSDGIVTLGVNKWHGVGQISSLYFGNAITPNSVVIGSSMGDITDKGGTLYQGLNAVGTVDYPRGSALINEPTFSASLNSLKFRPSMAELKVADTQKIDVTINNRSDSYTFNIFPPPAVSTLQVSYRSQNKWYDLYDDGSGALRGLSSGHGSGSINVTTGSGVVTLSELPDVGSAVLLSWGTRGNYFNRSTLATTAKMLLQLAQDADPASLTLSWAIPSTGGTVVNKTAKSDALGKITGDWTGKYDPQTHQVRIDTGSGFNHPVGVLDIVATYNKGEKLHQEFKAPLRDSQGRIVLDLGDKAVSPNTFKMRWNLLVEDYDAVITTVIEVTNLRRKWFDPYKVVRDDGNGKIIDETGIEMGTIDYTARRVTFKPDTTIAVPKAVYKNVLIDTKTQGNTTTKTYRTLFDHFEYIPTGAFMPTDESGLVEVWFYDTSPQSQVVENLKSGTIEIDLLPNYAEVIAPASVNFTWGSKRYFDKNGTLFCNLNPITGESSIAGAISYQNGVATLKNWQWTDGANPNVVSLVTSISGNPVDSVTFRTPKAPLTAGGLSVRATALDGTLITAKAGIDGKIKNTNIEGTADFEYGVASVRFGKWVTVTDEIKKEPWYVEEAVVNGKIWQPKPVFAESITYNADATSYLPIDSSVVKINTVRLPQDGRVPIFRRGDDILITNRKVDNLGSAFTGSSTVMLSRKDVDRICINDDNGKTVLATLWDYDLDQGTLTFAPALDLSAYKMPLFATHTQEMRNRILDLDIDGTLSLMFPMNRDYAVEDTYVSSMLLNGDDLQVRVSIPFTQRNWDGVWRDTPNGAQLLNKLNLKDYPMLLTDDGAITDNWLIDFDTSTQFKLYSEALGFVGRYDTLTDLAPINPATNKPYFTIPKKAFGTDTPWATHDVIRFKTWGTLMPVWVLCAVQPNANPPKGTDGFEQYLFGDTTEIKG